MENVMAKHRKERNLAERLLVYIQLVAAAVTCAGGLIETILEIIKVVAHSGVF